MHAIWRIHPAHPERARELADSLRIHPLTAQLLLNREVTTLAEAARFLRPGLNALEDPWELPDMERAIDRLAQAVARREPILIFGDSDVDGLTASVILYETLRDRGAIVRARQSNRILDGYGLPRRLAQQLARSSTGLLILVDCGTNQPEEVRQLAAKGIETVIVDHHVPLDGWAKPHALLNPHRATGAGRGLCSAGLAFKVAQALLGTEAPERLAASLDLAALGTLADCSPLLGESRVIVSAGLSRIVNSHRPGLRRLCEATQTTEPDPNHVVRRLVPRLNASGRLGDAAAVWHLLRDEDDGRLEEWLEAAEAAHTATKQLHRQLIAEAEDQVSRLHFRDQLVMVVGRSGWPQGLMGPLASQLAERYGRPAIAMALGGQRCVGSGRSVPHVNLFEVLRACQELLVQFGGHAQACGLTVDRKHVERFRELVNQHARRSLGPEGLTRTRTIDLELPLKRVSLRWVEDTERFAPFGHGNPRPTVAIRGLALEAKSPRTAVLSDGTVRVDAKGPFATGLPAERALGSRGRYDVIATPVILAGQVVLSVSDVRASAAPSEPAPISSSPCRRAPA